jgi:hypothetical protein
VDAEHGKVPRDAFSCFGKGWHRAGLSVGERQLPASRFCTSGLHANHEHDRCLHLSLKRSRQHLPLLRRAKPEATIDLERLPGDPPRVGRREKRDGISDVGGLAVAAQGSHLGDPQLGIGIRL